MAHDGSAAPMIVGMVHVHCPACGQPVEVDVRVSKVDTQNGAYLRVAFQDEAPEHRCVGRRA